MPAAQVIDLSPTPRRETTLEQTVGAFTNRHRENQVNQQENDALKQIYSRFQQDGQRIEQTIQAIQTDPNISPTRRVETMNQLLGFHKINQGLQREAVKQRNDEQQKLVRQEEIERAKKALEESNATPAEAELYSVSPTGGQTEIIKSVLERNSRQQNNPNLGEGLEDFDKELTPNQRVKRQDQRYTVQTPLFIKNNEKIAGLDGVIRSVDTLMDLDQSGKIKQGLYALNINPKTGDLLIPGLATAEEQLFVKTVNDFTVKAKDSFGARVTNFELDRFMQRLPTLANSADGRALIMAQMKNTAEAEALDARELQKVLDEYGIRNIDYADAERIARKRAEPLHLEMKEKNNRLENASRDLEKQIVEESKTKVKDGYVVVRSPEGKIKQFPEKNISSLEARGYKRI